MEDIEGEADYLAACGCAAFLMLGIVAPSFLTRTSWERWSADGGTKITDDPSGYVGLVALCGIAALVALVVGVRLSRVAFAAALAAAVAFAFATYVTVTYWLGFPLGERLLEGQVRLGEGVAVHLPPLLPVFALVAVVGLLSALTLTVRLRRGT